MEVSFSFSFIVIPSDERKAIETVVLDLSHLNDEDGVGGDQLPGYLQNQIDESERQQDLIQVTPLKRMSSNTNTNTNTSSADGIYAYYRHSKKDEADGNCNERATTLAMACGLLSHRFFGDVHISRLGYVHFTDTKHSHSHGERQLRNISIVSDEIELACVAGPDIRSSIMSKIKIYPDDLPACNLKGDTMIPDWLQNAAKSNYEDSASLSTLASVMKRAPQHQPDPDEDDHTHEHEPVDGEAISDNGIDKDDDHDVDSHDSSQNDNNTIPMESTKTTDQKLPIIRNAVTRVPLCLHCRRPADTLCPSCNGAYFCDDPRSCITDGWSHQCLCKTWALYTQRRKALSKFPFLQWHLPLLNRECQLSNTPYRNYLKNVLCVLPDDNSPITRDDLWWDTTAGSWWDTEVDGWEGGSSASAKYVDPSIRRTYAQGFRLEGDMLPPESRVTDVDAAMSMIQRDSCGLLRLDSWKGYYRLRKIPLTSPVALLCSFPLTVYHAIQRYGEVPITVAKMLKRPMRLHLIGVEKEMNFIDLFKEVGFLLPDDVMIEMVFIVRVDMLPPNCDSPSPDQEYSMKIDLTPNISLTIQSGTYAETIDPTFDCGSGPPDMIIAMNAGLYAYESWRVVVEYLSVHPGVVGVFTDYNEHSGLNCASLGGGKSRDSLYVNPFRQPRTMPVYSMNLPQFSNGFMYVYNEQELDM